MSTQQGHRPHTAPSPAPARGNPLSWQVLLVAVAAFIITALIYFPRANADDWASLWIAGDLFRSGNLEHLYDHHPWDFAALHGEVWNSYRESGTVPDNAHPFVQSPLVAMLLAPVALLPYPVTALLVQGGAGFAGVLMVACSWFIFLRRTIPMAVLLPVSVLVWMSPPLQWSASLGQTSPLIYAAVAYGIAASKTRPWLAGIMLAVAAIIKLTPVVVIVILLFFASRRKAAFYAIGVGAIALVASVVITGWSTFRTWFNVLDWMDSGLIYSPLNFSFDIFFHEPWSRDVIGTPIMEMDGAPLVVRLLVPLVLLALIGAAAWRQPGERAGLLTVGVTVVATVASPLVWAHYYLVAVLIAFAVPIWVLRTPVGAGLMAVAVAMLFPPLALPPGQVDAFSMAYFPAGSTLAVILLVLLAMVPRLVWPEDRHSRSVSPVHVETGR